jgi:hypothetical protein
VGYRRDTRLAALAKLESVRSAGKVVRTETRRYGTPRAGNGRAVRLLQERPLRDRASSDMRIAKETRRLAGARVPLDEPVRRVMRRSR